MKRLSGLVFLVIMASFLVGCASAPLVQKGNILSRGESKRPPAIIVIDNQTKKDIHLIVDGEWQWDIPAGKIKNFRLVKINEKMIFTIKFSNGRSFHKKLCIRPGRKYPITIRPPGVRVNYVCGRRILPEPYINVGWEMYKSISNRALREMRERMNK